MTSHQLTTSPVARHRVAVAHPQSVHQPQNIRRPVLIPVGEANQPAHYQHSNVTAATWALAFRWLLGTLGLLTLIGLLESLLD